MAFCVFVVLGLIVSNVLAVETQRLQVVEGRLTQLQAVVESLSKTVETLQAKCEQGTIQEEQGIDRSRRLLQQPSQDSSGAVVAFYAYLSATEHDPGHHHTIIFDTVIANGGNGYSKHSGVFTAPEYGYYVFSYTAAAYAGSRMPVQLVCNSKIIGSTAADSRSDTPFPSASTTNVIQLNQNDLCFIRTTTITAWTVGDVYSDEWSRSSFAGWKL